MVAVVEAASRNHPCFRPWSGCNPSAEDIAEPQLTPKARTRKWLRATRADDWPAQHGVVTAESARPRSATSAVVWLSMQDPPMAALVVVAAEIAAEVAAEVVAEVAAEVVAESAAEVVAEIAEVAAGVAVLVAACRMAAVRPD